MAEPSAGSGSVERFCPVCTQSFPSPAERCPEHDVALVVMESAAETLEPGYILAGRYRVESLLGQGGMGTVWRATQLSVERPVALKVLHPEAGASPAAVKRFFREARIASQLSHPNIVAVYDFDRTQSGTLFIAMELADGKPLEDILQAEGRLDPVRALRIAQAICDGLGEAHAQGLIHRDLKPGNVIVQQRFGRPDHARVLDFGIARSIDVPDGHGLTATGVVCGTPAYMAPEQACGKDLDGGADIYALGIMLFEMVTGRHPFTAGSPVELMMANVSQNLPSVGGVGLDTTRIQLLDQLIAGMTAKSPTKRLDAGRLRTRLQDVAETLQGLASAGDDVGAFKDTALAARSTELPPTEGLSSVPPAETGAAAERISPRLTTPLGRRWPLFAVVLLAAGGFAIYAFQNLAPRERLHLSAQDSRAAPAPAVQGLDTADPPAPIAAPTESPAVVGAAPEERVPDTPLVVESRDPAAADRRERLEISLEGPGPVPPVEPRRARVPPKRSRKAPPVRLF